MRALTLSLWLLTACSLLGGCVDDFFRRGGDGRVVQTPTSTCVHLDPENKLHPVVACELSQSYVVHKLKATVVYQKSAFQTQLREQILQYVRNTSYPDQSLGFASVRVWLVAPIFQPEEAFFVASVYGAAGNFAIRLPLEMNDWQLSGDNVSWLGKEAFPSRAARRTDVVLLTPQPYVTPADLRRFLDDSTLLTAAFAGKKLVQQVVGDGTVLRLTTAPFAATEVATRVMQSPRASKVVAAIKYQLAPAQDGYLASVFSFPLNAP